MTAAPQTSDMGAYSDAAPDALTAETVDLPGTAFSQRRVPPSIRVAMADNYPRRSNGPFCTLRSGSASTAPIRTFSWDFYVSHVVAPELGPVLTRQFGQYGLKSFSSIVQNFAWFHRTKPGPYDVSDIGGGYACQCFRLDEKVKVSQWSAWFADVRDERIVNANDQLMLTQYQAGTKPGFCADPSFPVHNGTQASQYGILAHVLAHQPGQPTTTACQMTDWRALAVLYYPTTWRLVSGLRPPTATGSFTTGGGTITLNFRARVFGQNVAWKFYLQKRTSTGWHTFKITRWSPRIHDVVQNYSFSPGSSTCVKYRVKAVNPVNDPVVHSAAALVNTPAGQFTPKGIGISPTGQCAL